MISRLIFVTSFVLLCFSIVSGIFLHWLLLSPKPVFETIALPQPGYMSLGQSRGGSATVSESDPSYLAIVGELPKQMDSSTSDTIQVKLTSLVPAPFGQVPYLSSNGDRAILYPDISTSLNNDLGNYCSLHSDCSSNPPVVKDLFDPGYELFASAHLIATSFDVQLLGATEQSADQVSIEWDWNIFPKSAGSQLINLDVDLHWKPVGNNGKADIFRQLWESDPIILVNPPPFVTPGQLTVSTTVSAFFGLIFAGVSGPRMLGELKKRRAGKHRVQVAQELEDERAKRVQVAQELEDERAKRVQVAQELKNERGVREEVERKLSNRERLRQE